MIFLSKTLCDFNPKDEFLELEKFLEKERMLPSDEQVFREIKKYDRLLSRVIYEDLLIHNFIFSLIGGKINKKSPEVKRLLKKLNII